MRERAGLGRFRRHIIRRNTMGNRLISLLRPMRRIGRCSLFWQGNKCFAEIPRKRFGRIRLSNTLSTDVTLLSPSSLESINYGTDNPEDDDVDPKDG